MELLFVVDTMRLLLAAPPFLNKQPVASLPASQPASQPATERASSRNGRADSERSAACWRCSRCSRCLCVQPYSKEIVFICSNEEPQQHCSGKPPWPVLPANESGFPCYIKAFTQWAAVTKSAAQGLGVWPLTVGVALVSSQHTNDDRHSHQQPGKQDT